MHSGQVRCEQKETHVRQDKPNVGIPRSETIEVNHEDYTV